MVDAISFAVQAAPVADGWATLARTVEMNGFEALTVGDHPGLTASPFVALGAAATATSSIGLGTAVLNAGVRHPFDIAADVATLESLSGGRTVLGLGAGHTPAEWAAVGASYPSPAERVERLRAVAHAVQELLAGETVTDRGPGFVLADARLDLAPARKVPLLVGGNSRAVIRVGAAVADVVEMGGLGRTLPDGHFHEIRWRPDQIDQTVSAFAAGAGARRPRLGAMVQLVALTEDAERVAARFIASAADRQPPDSLPTMAELLAVPFVLIGTVSEIVDKLSKVRDSWGVTRYTVRTGAVEDMGPVISALGGTPPDPEEHPSNDEGPGR